MSDTMNTNEMQEVLFVGGENAGRRIMLSPVVLTFLTRGSDGGIVPYTRRIWCSVDRPQKPDTPMRYTHLFAPEGMTDHEVTAELLANYRPNINVSHD